MKKLIEDLWNNNYRENIECRELSPEKENLMKHIADYHDNLLSSLTEEQKDILEKCDDCNAELTDICEREIFVYAFSLGAKIAIEIMNFNKG